MASAPWRATPLAVRRHSSRPQVLEAAECAATVLTRAHAGAAPAFVASPCPAARCREGDHPRDRFGKAAGSSPFAKPIQALKQ